MRSTPPSRKLGLGKVYLKGAVATLRMAGADISDQLLQQLFLLWCEHIVLTGEYLCKVSTPVILSVLQAGAGRTPMGGSRESPPAQSGGVAVHSAQSAHTA